jgi:hypothetical protein
LSSSGKPDGRFDMIADIPADSQARSSPLDSAILHPLAWSWYPYELSNFDIGWGHLGEVPSTFFGYRTVLRVGD